MTDAERAVADLLTAYGYDVSNGDLKETPARVVRMLDEMLEGRLYSNEEIVGMFGKCFDCASDQMVVESDIRCFSICEHHLALMYDLRISVGYIPCGKVLGLSKIARIAKMVCRRLQIQERIGADIADCITLATGSEDVAVLIEGHHGCMTARGIGMPDSTTRTNTLRGRFLTDSAKRAEFLALAR